MPIPRVRNDGADHPRRCGTPEHPDDPGGHQMVGFLSSPTGHIPPLEFAMGDARRKVTLPAQVGADRSDTTADLARRGFGLIQAPRYRFWEDIAAGRLVEVLPGFPPTPVFALHPHNRDAASRLRTFLDLLSGIFATGSLRAAGVGRWVALPVPVAAKGSIRRDRLRRSPRRCHRR